MQQGVKNIKEQVEHNAHPCVAAWLLRTAVAVPLIELMGNWSQGKRGDEVTACIQPCVHIYVTVTHVYHRMHADVCLDRRLRLGRGHMQFFSQVVAFYSSLNSTLIPLESSADAKHAVIGYHSKDTHFQCSHFLLLCKYLTLYIVFMTDL